MKNLVEAKRLESLYVSYHGRYVVAKDGRYFTARVFETKEYKRLDLKVLADHLNQQYAVGVFSSMYGSKFICFDVDLSSSLVVQSIIQALSEYGFPKEHIYVSSSGGKGYHVEMFFTDILPLKLLKELYDWVITKKNLDSKKIEFRPTYTQAIKLPLSKHHKTGNICWYLNPETLEPIEDHEYLMSIAQVDRDVAETLIKNHHVDQSSHCGKKDEDMALPLMTSSGMRHNMMKSIAVRERYKGTPQEEIQTKLVEWAAQQNPEYITDPWKDVMYDAESLASYVWKPTFLARRGGDLILYQSDLKDILSCHASLCKRILFLIILYIRKYDKKEAYLSAAQISCMMGCTIQGAQKALNDLCERGVILKKSGKTSFHDGKFVAHANSYEYKSSHEGNIVRIDWDFKEETFMEVYVRTMRDNVPQEDYKKYFTKKEREELLKNENV